MAQKAHMLNPDAWPRSYNIEGHDLTFYMPQLVEWKGYLHLKANVAIAIKLKDIKETHYGILTLNAHTSTNVEQQQVSLGKRTISQVRFPELNDKHSIQARKLVSTALTPEEPVNLPLQPLLSAVERADAMTRDTKINTTPPPIFYSQSPAILLSFIGEPKLERINPEDPSLMFAINTNWDVIFDTAHSDYYLLAENQWLSTKDLTKGPWLPANSTPPSFQNLPDDANWSEAKSKLEITPHLGHPPKVFYSSQPAEIILTDGQPQLCPISGTKLFYVANSQSDLFLDISSNHYYYLTSGRWFSSPKLTGPWIYASMELPVDFYKIPENHTKAHVLTSVPGTPHADEAVILASIPQTAKVSRANTHIYVHYDGEPHFQTIPKSDDVSFATNTSYDVFLVKKKYYCCYKGVWFIAPKATGTWVVCDSVPDEIYTIPAESPKYNVTHVYVYESTPTSVEVGVTSGYSGSYVAQGLVVFGLGYWMGKEIAEDYYSCYRYGHYYPKPCWYGYGCGAYYNGAKGGFYGRGAYCYGPYGGAGHGAAYNPATGTFARSSYAYGPYNAAGTRAAYNPWTNTGARQVGASTPYGSWSSSAVVRNNQWIRGAHASNEYGSVGGIQTSRGGKAVGVNRTYGSDNFAAKTATGNVYVGHDGNIYKKDSQNRWQQRKGGTWQGASHISPYQSPYKANPTTHSRTATRTTTTHRSSGYSSRRSTSYHLNRDSYSRSRSNYHSHSSYSRSHSRSGGHSRRR